MRPATRRTGAYTTANDRGIPARPHSASAQPVLLREAFLGWQTSAHVRRAAGASCIVLLLLAVWNMGGGGGGGESALVDSVPHYATPRAAAGYRANVTVVLNELVPVQTMASLFVTGTVARFGSGQLRYRDTVRAPVRKDYLDNMTVAERPRVPERDLCVITFRYHQLETVVRSRDAYFSRCHLFVMGDEFCNQTAALDGNVTFRQFESKAFQNPPLALPLGPRDDFWAEVHAQGADRNLILPCSQRPKLFNAVFSKFTSPSRDLLADLLESRRFHDLRHSGVIQIAGSWTFVPTEETGHLTVPQYVETLRATSFTLAPVGHNPECFRIYEAIEVGSIPIIALDESYTNHSCRGALGSMVESGAPFPLLRSWDELPALLRKYRHDSLAADNLQRRVRSWYADYMRGRIRRFENALAAPPP